MSNIHRLQWIDAQIRMERYPNARAISAKFEISRRQALRDFEYMRDSLSAPLVYDAQHRGYHYSSNTFVLPGLYITSIQRNALRHLADYYPKVAGNDSVYTELAQLFLRIAADNGRSNRTTAAAVPYAPIHEVPYQARVECILSGAPGLPAVQPFIISAEDNQLNCEFLDTSQFLSALMSTGRPFRIIWPGWLRAYLLRHLQSLLNTNS